MRVLHKKRLIFIAKPRCGSTKVRRTLDPYLEPTDLSVDYAQPKSLLHPHIPAPALREVLERYYEVHGLDDYHFFTVVRHPVDMLRSYYKFFKPDSRSRYFFNSDWEGAIGMGFSEWITSGKVGFPQSWAATAPSYISSTDLSPLSLEAHFCGPDNQLISTNVFKLENLCELSVWLADTFQLTLSDVSLKVNQSEGIINEGISPDALQTVRDLFPMESLLYNI